ncbi:MAG: hypothetical protein NO516_03720 [Candidatus Methanomethylicia archaeon]|nr:hypothetical protein [Candidatus Methanomethylicia archaeon]
MAEGPTADSSVPPQKPKRSKRLTTQSVWDEMNLFKTKLDEVNSKVSSVGEEMKKIAGPAQNDEAVNLLKEIHFELIKIDSKIETLGKNSNEMREEAKERGEATDEAFIWGRFGTGLAIMGVGLASLNNVNWIVTTGILSCGFAILFISALNLFGILPLKRKKKQS